MKPLAPRRFKLQATVDQATHDKLRHAQALLSHKLPSGDIAQILDVALDALVEKLEKRKLAATQKPRASARPTNGRTIPARVKRAVWKRDGGQCTFVSSNGHRCNTKKFLEYDHIDPVARGGEATTGNLRLRCRTHNQLEAEQVFGAGFMQAKRSEAA